MLYGAAMLISAVVGRSIQILYLSEIINTKIKNKQTNKTKTTHLQVKILP